MILSRSTLVLMLIFTVSLCDQAQENKPDPEDAIPPTTTTPAPSSTTTTPAPSSTTTTPAPSPTTPTPSPTTTVPPPTSPAPTPAPDHSEWSVKYKNGTICILAKMHIIVKVPYNTTENKPTEVQFDVHPKNANCTGNCSPSNGTQILTINSGNVTITFVFVENTTAKSYDLATVNVSVVCNVTNFPNNTMCNGTTWLNFTHQVAEFTTPSQMSYTCSDPEKLMLNSTQPGASLVVSDVQVEAFGTKKENKFSEAMDCATFETPDIVPIAVGCALAALVIVVLISYLVGRRRSQARGYLSM